MAAEPCVCVCGADSQELEKRGEILLPPQQLGPACSPAAQKWLLKISSGSGGPSGAAVSWDSITELPLGRGWSWNRSKGGGKFLVPMERGEKMVCDVPPVSDGFTGIKRAGGFDFGCGLMVSPAWPLCSDGSGVVCADCQSGGHSSAAPPLLVLSGESALPGALGACVCVDKHQ